MDEINKEKKFFKKVENVYKDAIMLEQKRTVSRIERIFGGFALDKMKIEFKENIMNDMKVIKKWAEKDVVRRLEKDFSKRNFLAAVRNALKNGPAPEVTMDMIFRGDLSHGPKKELRIGQNNIVMQIEINEFFSRFYPNEAAEIICDIIEKIKSVKKYKTMGLSQTQIVKFLRGGNKCN